MTKTNKKYFWYGLLAVIIGSANATIIKKTTASIDPFTFNTLRYVLASMVTLPFFVQNYKRISPQNLRYSIYSGLCLFGATISYVSAINLSKATYVTLLTLVNPVFLVIFSLKLTNDTINLKRISGFSLAAIGALLVVAGPMLLSGNTDVYFYPKATILVGIQVVLYPLAVIFARKANESRKKLHIGSVIFIQTSIIAVCSLSSGVLLGKLQPINELVLSPSLLFGIFYSGILIGVVDRILNIKSYEKVGSAVNGGLVYLGIFLSITISVTVLGETLPLIAALGGLVILLGIVVTEHGLSKKHRHNHAFHHH